MYRSMVAAWGDVPDDIPSPADQRMFIRDNYKSLDRDDLIAVFSTIIADGQQAQLRSKGPDTILSLARISDETIYTMYKLMEVIVKQKKSLATI